MGALSNRSMKNHSPVHGNDDDISRGTSNDRLPVLTGWMRKRGAFNTSFKNRLFHLNGKGGTGTIRYYASESEYNKKYDR